MFYQKVLSQHDRFDKVKAIIKENNVNSGVKPSGIPGITADAAMNGIVAARTRPQSTQAPRIEGLSDEIPASTSAYAEGVRDGNDMVAWPPSMASTMATSRAKPSVHPKPNALLAGQMSSPPTEDLAARFAQLRTAKEVALAPVQDPRIRTRPIVASMGFDNISAARNASPRTRSKYIDSGRPSGPREMPNMSSGSPRTTKIPLDTSIPDMPRAPDAVYSPARSLDTPITLNTPDNAARRHPPDISQQPPITEKQSSRETNAYSLTSHSDRATNPYPTYKSVTTINAGSLYEYLQHGSNGLRILLVDIRNREQFDSGHIFWKSIICVDPITLRADMSADQLSETLILSPNDEQKFFELRDQFDVVVFYDQCSSSVNTTASGQSSPLLHFSQAISEYSYEKRLKAPPVLLVGGLDAWIDLMGNSALKSSDTSAVSRAGKMEIQHGRSPSGVAIPRRSQRVLNGRSHPYESKPSARGRESDSSLSSDRESSTKRDHRNTDDNDKGPKDDFENDIAFIRTTEDFVRRFPEASSMKQSMVYGPPSYAGDVGSGVSRLSSDHNTIQAHTVPNNTVLSATSSTALVRPPPAVPRPSYQGLSHKSWDYQTVQSLPRISARNSSAVPQPPPGPTKGLHNYNNTCYMNSTIQCLGHTPTLRIALRRQPAPGSGGADPQLTITPALNGLLEQLWNGPGNSVKPDNFRVGIPDRIVERVLSCSRGALLHSVVPVLLTAACQVTTSKMLTSFCL